MSTQTARYLPGPDLDVSVEVGNGTAMRTVEIGLTLADSKDLVRVVEHCGREALTELVHKGWNESAAKAILYVNLIRALNEGDWPDPADMSGVSFSYEQMDFDWGPYAPYMLEPDWDLEAELAELSETP